MARNTRFAVAIHVMGKLAFAEERPVTSEQIAQSVGTNATAIRRLMRDLVKASLVTADLGAGGGSRLTRAPEKITLLAIHRAVQTGPLFAAHRPPPLPECIVALHVSSVLDTLFGEAQAAAEDSLKNRTLADVIELVGKARGKKRR
jgi:Rrf2 family protein